MKKPGKIPQREVVRRVCLSLGLLQPGDSRDIIVDVLHVLVKARRTQEKLTCDDIEKLVISERKRNKLALHGIAISNIRRQLKRLKELFIVEKVAHYYRITEWMTLDEIFEQHIEKYYLDSILSRVKEHLSLLK